MLRRTGRTLLLALTVTACTREIETVNQKHLPLNRWLSRPAGRDDDTWLARPGERYRVRTRWAGGDPHLCLMAGKQEAPEFEIEDAVEQVRDCPKPDAHGETTAEVRVPEGANTAWFSVIPEGAPTMLEIRFERE